MKRTINRDSEKLKRRKIEKKKNGFRTILAMVKIQKRSQRTTIFDKRLFGLLKKIIQIIIMTSSDVILYVKSKDTQNEYITISSKEVGIPARFLILGTMLQDCQDIDTQELDEVFCNIETKMEKDKSKIVKFLNVLKGF